jgi:hypothetical protein
MPLKYIIAKEFCDFAAIITTIPDVKAIKRSLLDNMKADNENIKKLTLSAEKGNAIAQPLAFLIHIYCVKSSK